MAQLDQVTQQNAALVEESAAAAESLKHQAAKLAEVVGFFKMATIQAMAAGAFSAPPAPKALTAARPSPSRDAAVTRPAAKAPQQRAPNAKHSADGAANAGTDDWTSF